MRARIPCVLGLAASVLSCALLSPRTGKEQAATCAAAVADSESSSGYGGASPDTDAGDCVSIAQPEAGPPVIPFDGGLTGNILIADEDNNRVIEITRQGDIVWSYGDGSTVPGPTSIVAPYDAERLANGETLMTGKGAAAGTESGCPADGGGCPDNRVLIVNDATNQIVWQYGADGGVFGSGPGQLYQPAASVLVPTTTGDHILIADQGNARVIEVDRATSDVVWQFPPPTPTAAQRLVAPNSVERLFNGNTLIADLKDNRVLEVTAGGAIAWQYPSATGAGSLNTPAFASRLPSGTTLITDARNNRVIEVDSANPANIVWSYDTSSRSTQGTLSPTRAVRLANQHTLVTESFVDQVIEIDGTPQNNVVYTFGAFGVSGSAVGELNHVYDAKIVGDFTGLTPPSM